MSRQEAIDFATQVLEDNNTLIGEKLALAENLRICERRFKDEIDRQELLGINVPMAAPVGEGRRGITRSRHRSNRRRSNRHRSNRHRSNRRRSNRRRSNRHRSNRRRSNRN